MRGGRLAALRLRRRDALFDVRRTLTDHCKGICFSEGDVPPESGERVHPADS
jgi:hypothetical protein